MKNGIYQPPNEHDPDGHSEAFVGPGPRRILQLDYAHVSMYCSCCSSGTRLLLNITVYAYSSLKHIRQI